MSVELPVNHYLDKDLKCPYCGASLVEKVGRYGKFLVCPNFPDCKYSCSIDVDDRDRTWESYLSVDGEILNG